MSRSLSGGRVNPAQSQVLKLRVKTHADPSTCTASKPFPLNQTCPNVVPSSGAVGTMLGITECGGARLLPCIAGTVTPVFRSARADSRPCEVAGSASQSHSVTHKGIRHVA